MPTPLTWTDADERERTYPFRNSLDAALRLFRISDASPVGAVRPGVPTARGGPYAGAPQVLTLTFAELLAANPTAVEPILLLIERHAFDVPWVCQQLLADLDDVPHGNRVPAHSRDAVIRLGRLHAKPHRVLDVFDPVSTTDPEAGLLQRLQLVLAQRDAAVMSFFQTNCPSASRTSDWADAWVELKARGILQNSTYQ